MAYGSNTMKGEYQLKNPSKYKGVKAPTYRSSYELAVHTYLDTNPNIIEWYAELPIPYYSEVKGGRMARYFVDIFVKYMKGDEVVTEIIEIKPWNQVYQKPKKGKGKRAEQTFINEQLTYMNNQEKWTAAKKYAEERGWNFRILTEREIFRG